MGQFPPHARVAVRPLAHRREGDNVIIGDLRRQVFLTIPAEALDILTALADGRTVGEAVRLHEQTHAETPDVEDFLAALADEGLVAPWDDAEPLPAAPEGRVSPATARRPFAAPVLALAALLIGGGAALVASDPGVVPGPTVLVFHDHLAAMAAALVAITLAGVMVHEAAHVLAARAAGVPARIGAGNRLWYLVAETDMTGIWLAPKRWRHLAFLAGPLVDAASAALLVALLWAERRGWVGLGATFEQLVAATLFTTLMRLLWQCFLFVRTDFYYVLATALNCNNLLADTEDLLRNRWARLRGSAPRVDQSAIPPAEMRAVRGYAGVWLVGRALAFASLVLVTVPVLAGYGSELARAATGGDSSYGTVDLLTLAVLTLGFQGGGLVIWIRSLHRRRTQRRTDALAPS